jgi:hypothetical protein
MWLRVAALFTSVDELSPSNRKPIKYLFSEGE